jgi:hypothetical protein
VDSGSREADISRVILAIEPGSIELDDVHDRAATITCKPFDFLRYRAGFPACVSQVLE